LARWSNERRAAWAGSDRKGRLPADWGRLRQVVLTRCGLRCEWVEDGFRCPSPATDVDHIVPGDDHRPGNLQGLCNPHHLIKTARDTNAKRAETRKLRRLPEEPQPGLIKGPPRPTEHRGF
jgi:5-methylcytosine-specific restriction endonuclease McrA